MKKIIEIRPGEGGQDAKMLMDVLAAIYQNYAALNGWLTTQTRIGAVIHLSVEGDKESLSALHYEAGGHRFQRIPPNEKRGRVHTSTVTVAVLDGNEVTAHTYPDKDFKIEWFSGSGAGGQHRNKHANSCRLIHLPSGLKQESQCRKRQNSYDEAHKSLIKLLSQREVAKAQLQENTHRKAQVGSGMRADKIRTYRYQDGKALDHQSGLTVRLKQVLAGDIALFHCAY